MEKRPVEPILIDLKNRENGDGEGEESQEQLDAAVKNLSSLTRGDGQLISISKQDLSLLKQILTASTEEYKEQVMWRMCDFVDENEALDHVAAYYEAKDLGMDTNFNVAFMFALVSANRKTNHSNLMGQLIDAVQHGKWAQNAGKGKAPNGYRSSSPLN